VATYKAFCAVVGTSPQSLNDIKNERRAVTLDMVHDTCNAYPVSLSYVVMGTEPMFTTQIVEPIVEENVEAIDKNKINPDESHLQLQRTERQERIRTEIIVATQDTSRNATFAVVNHKAAANFLTGYQSQEYYEQLGAVTLPRQLVGGNKQGILYQIEGDSMTPKFQPGDWVACVLLERGEWREVIDSDCYVIVSASHGIQFKRLRNHLPRGYVQCRSDNRRHSAYIIQEDDILQLYHFVLHVSPDGTNPDDILYQKVDHLEDTTTDLRAMFEQLQRQVTELKITKTTEKEPQKSPLNTD